MRVALLLLFSFLAGQLIAQVQFPADPMEARFVTSDIANFWVAYDSIGKTDKNPFHSYIRNGSIGLQGFVPYRIMGADSMLSMAKRRGEDYEKIRGVSARLKQKENEVLPYFYALEYWYPYAVYPPVYFVVGRFNSEGTTSGYGLIIGIEKFENLDKLASIVIHYQQKYPEGPENLLQQSILEGAADFVSELVTGLKSIEEAYAYGYKHKDALCKEFAQIMHAESSEDWLYYTSGKDDRPNDLGYWIGYEIVKAYFDKMEDKKLAVNHILNIDDYDRFLKDGGYLTAYVKDFNPCA